MFLVISPNLFPSFYSGSRVLRQMQVFAEFLSSLGFGTFVFLYFCFLAMYFSSVCLAGLAGWTPVGPPWDPARGLPVRHSRPPEGPPRGLPRPPHPLGGPRQAFALGPQPAPRWDHSKPPVGPQQAPRGLPRASPGPPRALSPRFCRNSLRTSVVHHRNVRSEFQRAGAWILGGHE